MFEESLLSPRVAERNAVVRFAMLAAATVQCSLAAAFWIAPLLHPERLQLERLAPPIVLPPIHRPPEIRVQPSHSSQVVTAAMQVPAAPTAAASPRIAHAAVQDPAPISSLTTLWSGDPGGLPTAVGAAGPGPGVRVAGPAAAGSGPAHRVRVSSGISSGLLLAPIRPSYPRIAAAAHVEGTVMVEAVISRTGEVVRAHVTSGPAMLAGAALDAVRGARYRPYKLNGEPTEVETTFSIVFHLGAG